MKRLSLLNRFVVYLGPAVFLAGGILALVGNALDHPARQFFGLCLAAAGMIVWGCHGIRRRGKRPGFLLMVGLGGAFLALHLNYRLSDYRWAQINSMTIGSTSATLAYLEARITLILCLLLASAGIGLFHPLPGLSRPGTKPSGTRRLTAKR